MNTRRQCQQCNYTSNSAVMIKTMSESVYYDYTYTPQPKYNIGEWNDLRTSGIGCQHSSVHFYISRAICPQSQNDSQVIFITGFLFLFLVCYCVLLMFTMLVQGENVQPKDSWTVLYSSQSSSSGKRFFFCVAFSFSFMHIDSSAPVAPVGVSELGVCCKRGC